MTSPTSDDQTPLTPAQRWSRALGVLILGLALLVLLGFPWGLGALALGPAAAVIGIIVLAAKGSSTLSTWAKANAIIGIVLGGFSTLMAMGMIVLFTPLNDLAECQARAITTTASAQCQADFAQDYEELLSDYGVVLPDAG